MNVLKIVTDLNEFLALFGKNKVADKLTYKLVYVWMDHNLTY